MPSRCDRCAGISLAHLVQLAQAEFYGHDFPKEAFYRHHQSFEDLEQAASDGCDFCQLILDGFKSTPEDGKATIWQRTSDGYSYDLEGAESKYSAVKYLEVSDVKISINASHVFTGKPIDQVRLFDTLLVKVGPIAHQMDEDDSDFTDGLPELELPELELTLTVDRDRPCWLDDIAVGRLSLDPELGSTTNFDIARRWLRECREQHLDCLSPHNPQLPTRVIDVRRPRLVEIKGENADYVALSHCWGGVIDVLLTNKTLRPFQEKIPLESLSQNFQDAITITQQLGFRFLWIDSLCILQDSKQDWERESKKMGSVYNNAALTISAIAARGSAEGILRSSPSPFQDPRMVSLEVESPDRTPIDVKVERRNFLEEDLRGLSNNGPLASRGWTLQELVLSPRHLFYGKRQIYWKCPYGYRSAEGMPPANRFPCDIDEWMSSPFFAVLSDDQRRDSSEPPDKQKILSSYYSMINEYSHRALTYDSDKLPGLSGLSQRLLSVLGGEYLAGLWSCDFLNGLCWYSEGNSCRHVNRYRAPSWSWAITNEWVLFAPTWLTPVCELEILQYKVVPRDRSNPFGEIESARLLVRGHTIRVVRSAQVVLRQSMRNDIGNCFYDEPDEAQLRLNIGYCTTQCFRVTSTKDSVETDYVLTMLKDGSGMGHNTSLDIEEEKFSAREYIALLVYAVEGSGGESSLINCLVLSKTGKTSDRGEGEYERVGLLQVTHWDQDWLGTWSKQTLALV